jgi:hypothetical protein
VSGNSLRPSNQSVNECKIQLYSDVFMSKV